MALSTRLMKARVATSESIMKSLGVGCLHCHLKPKSYGYNFFGITIIFYLFMQTVTKRLILCRYLKKPTEML